MRDYVAEQSPILVAAADDCATGRSTRGTVAIASRCAGVATACIRPSSDAACSCALTVAFARVSAIALRIGALAGSFGPSGVSGATVERAVGVLALLPGIGLRRLAGGRRCQLRIGQSAIASIVAGVLGLAADLRDIAGWWRGALATRHAARGAAGLAGHAAPAAGSAAGGRRAARGLGGLSADSAAGLRTRKGTCARA